MTKVLRAEFISSASGIASLPEEGLPEIAFVGRSNAGKSTLINRLCERKKLVHASKAPGRTQTINFFEVQLRLESGEEQSLILVDLPGFGFAKFSKEKREELSQLTVDYIRDRRSLACVCLLNESKRLPERDELAIQKLVSAAQRKFIMVISKTDRLSKRELSKRIVSLQEAYKIPSEQIALSSKEISPSELWTKIIS